MINRGRHIQVHKREINGRSSNWLNAGLCGLHCTEKRSLVSDPSSSRWPPLFSGENTVCQFPWRQTHCFMAALKSILSDDTYSLTFLSNTRSLWAFLFITTTETFTRLFTMFRAQWQGEKSGKLSLCNFIPLIVHCGPSVWCLTEANTTTQWIKREVNAFCPV